MADETGQPPFLKGCKIFKFDEETVKNWQKKYTSRRHAKTVVDTLLRSSYDVLYFTPDNIFLIENAGALLMDCRFKEKTGERLPQVYFAHKGENGKQMFCSRCPGNYTFLDVDRFLECASNVVVCSALVASNQMAQPAAIATIGIPRRCNDNGHTAKQPTAIKVYQTNSSVYANPMFSPVDPNTREKTQEPEVEELIRGHQYGDDRQQAGAGEASFDAMTERYRAFPARIETFQNSPLLHVAEQLAEAGFWHTGEGDIVECYACAGQLKDCTSDDDPWIRHCQSYPNCPFANEDKGEDFIKDILEGSQNQELSEDTTNCDNSHKTIELIQGIVDKYRTELTSDRRYDIQTVTTAVNALVEQGNVRPSVEELLQKIEMHFERNNTFSVHNEDREFGQTIEGMKEENDYLKRRSLCVTCKRKLKNVLFLPCADQVVCAKCSNDMRKCSRCGREIQKRIRTYRK